jgi:hypothetical protein
VWLPISQINNTPMNEPFKQRTHEARYARLGQGGKASSLETLN